MPNTTVIRRANAVALYQDFLRERIAAGEAPKGLDQSFAAAIEVSPSMWSQIKTARPISDKLARQLEHHTKKPAGWLDLKHAITSAPDAAEDNFVELARSLWRDGNARRRRELLRLLRQEAKAGGHPPKG